MTSTTKNNGEFKIVAPKTYATTENVRKAVAKKGMENYRHFIMTGEDGRFYPVFIGMVAIENGIHFHFNVVG